MSEQEIGESGGRTGGDFEKDGGMAVMTPRRITRKRSRGWKMPPNTVYVGRPSKWGNPFVVDRDDRGWIVRFFDARGISYQVSPNTQHEAHASATRLYVAYLTNDGSKPAQNRDDGGMFLAELARQELRGKNLSCWCPADMPCHADVLLLIANGWGHM